MRSSGKTGTIDLYGVVGNWGGISRQQFNSDLKALGDISELVVNLATIGGDFDNGLSIYNILKQHPAFVTMNVMGYALSMGSHIMLAGDKINIVQNGLVMMHRVQTWSFGDAGQLRKDAAIAEKHEAAVRPLYAVRMGISEQEVQQLLVDETWYTANEALAAGLVDAIIDPIDLDAIDGGMPANAWQMVGATFNHPPAAIKHKLTRGAGQGAERITSRTLSIPTFEKEDTAMTPEQLAELKGAMTGIGSSMQAGFEAMTAQIKESMQVQSLRLESTDPQEDPVLQKLAAVEEKLKSLQSEHDALQEKLADLEKTPAARRRQPEHGSDADGAVLDTQGHYS